MDEEVKKCKEWLEEKYGLTIYDRFEIIEKVIEYCKESEDYRIEPPETCGTGDVLQARPAGTWMWRPGL